MHCAQVQAEDAEARASRLDFEERVTAPARSEPLVPLDFNATHEGERVAARRRTRAHPRICGDALDDVRQRGLLQQDNVRVRRAYRLGQLLLAARAAVAYVVTEEREAHVSPTFPMRVR